MDPGIMKEFNLPIKKSDTFKIPFPNIRVWFRHMKDDRHKSGHGNL